MEKKDKKPLYIGISIVAIAAIVIAVVVAIMVGKNNNGGNDGGNGGDGNGTAQVDDTVRVSELANVDLAISYGDYDSMLSLAQDIQNGLMTGKIVKIDGTVSHPGTLYSIVEEDEQGTGSVGTQFVIEGSGDYPQDGDRVIITGKVVENAPLYYIIKTLPEFVEVQGD